MRLPRIVGQGRALEIILTGRKVPAEECLNIGLCEYFTPKGGAREKAEELARQIARFPQVCVRADRRSAIKSHGLGVREALIQEWYNGREALIEDGVAGASRFKDGLGRHGDFGKNSMNARFPFGSSIASISRCPPNPGFKNSDRYSLVERLEVSAAEKTNISPALDATGRSHAAPGIRRHPRV